jgi:hypothetical protein
LIGTDELATLKFPDGEMFILQAEPIKLAKRIEG